MKVIERFLQGRFQSVVIDGVNSKPSSVHSGVPQGMVLAPLYTVLLNYTDDVLPLVLLKTVSFYNLAWLWAEKWQIELNPSK